MNSAVLIPLPIVLPLFGAVASLILYRWRVVQRVLSITIVSASLAISIVLLFDVDRNGIEATQMGAWPAPYGITLVADLLSTIMLTASLVAVLTVLIYSLGQEGPDRVGGYFHPAYLALTAGVSGAFLTGDLFNLFVMFEIMLVSSYVLITLRGGAGQVRHGMTYVVISLLSSSLFVMALAFIYTETGTVNMAELSVRMAEVPDPVRDAIGLLFLLVFGIKAALFPLFFWLPDSYPAASTPVTAIFAGLLTKVGVYAIVRTQTLLFHEGGVAVELLIVAGLTMVIGGFGAIAQNDIKRILSFHIVSQIGYMILGLGLFTIVGIAAAIFYVIHNMLVKTALLLFGGLVEAKRGTASLAKLGGLLRESPLLAALFLIPALSLAGIPPFSGFVAKLAIIEAGFDASAYTIIAISLGVGVMTLFSMTKIWAGVFWGKPKTEPSLVAKSGVGAIQAHASWSPTVMTVATVVLVAATLGVALGAEAILGLATGAAESLLDTREYVQAVLG